MSKKKNKKNKKSTGGYGQFAIWNNDPEKRAGYVKVSKSDKKKLDKMSKKHGSVKSTLDSKEKKENHKIASAPYVIPKDLLRNRAKCNHSGERMSVAEFKATMNPYICPMLDSAVRVFGEDNVMICKDCYDVVIPAVNCKISGTDIENALTTLYMAVSVAVQGKKMDAKEVRELNELRPNYKDWDSVVHLMACAMERVSSVKADEKGRSDANVTSQAVSAIY